jgi:Tail tubular protein
MTTLLSVTNECLAIMGEAPLSTLNEDHEFKAAALSELAKAKEQVLAKKGTGWWFNAESLTLYANPTDGRIYLPDDTIGIIVFDSRPNLTKRGRFVYNLEGGTDIFPAGTILAGKLVRNLDIEDVPTTVAMLIAARTVLAFQNLYDGDQTKTRNLSALVQSLSVDAESEHVRNRKVNLFDSSAGVQRLRNIVRQSRS